MRIPRDVDAAPLKLQSRHCQATRSDDPGAVTPMDHDPPHRLIVSRSEQPSSFTHPKLFPSKLLD